MSKGLGSKIGIKFTEDLVGDISLQGSILEKQDGTWVANGTYSGAVDSARDESTSTYWQSRSTANYIQINRPSTKLLGFKVYKGSSYRPSDYILSVSEDGINYVDVASGSLTATTGWETIMFNSHIEYEYFRFNFGYTTRLYLYELVLIVDECEFIVTGQEYKYVNGQLKNKMYPVDKVERHPTEPRSILLTIDWWGRFNNVESEITIAYDATKGNLTGQGGTIESFITTFTPVDLAPEHNPGIIETITGAPTISINYLGVTYYKGYGEETITAAPAEITVAFLSVEEINP